MADINTCTFTGHVSNRFEPKGGGPLKLKLEVANEFRKRDGSEGVSRLFLEVTLWGKLGEECTLREGDHCFVVGELASDSYEKDDGTKVWKTVLKATRAGHIGAKPLRAQTPTRSDADDSFFGAP